jgi:CheY-like chemotaxis protein
MTYSFAPDIVITDAMMPGLSGFDLIREVKSRPETARIPVILLTSLV